MTNLFEKKQHFCEHIDEKVRPKCTRLMCFNKHLQKVWVVELILLEQLSE